MDHPVLLLLGFCHFDAVLSFQRDEKLSKSSRLSLRAFLLVAL